VDFLFHSRARTVRTNLFQKRGQWALAMRTRQDPACQGFAQLGLLEHDQEDRRSTSGIVLVAGSTGSWQKSTTLAECSRHINSNVKKHIITSKTRLNSF